MIQDSERVRRVEPGAALAGDDFVVVDDPVKGLAKFRASFAFSGGAVAGRRIRAGRGGADEQQVANKQQRDIRHLPTGRTLPGRASHFKGGRITPIPFCVQTYSTSPLHTASQLFRMGTEACRDLVQFRTGLGENMKLGPTFCCFAMKAVSRLKIAHVLVLGVD